MKNSINNFKRKIKSNAMRLLFGFVAFLMAFFPIFNGQNVKAESATNNWIGGYYYSGSSYWGQHSRKTVGGDEVFCVEPSIAVQTGEGYSQGNVSEIMSNSVKDRIELIHHYGYTLSNKTDRDYVFTQTAIWEALGYSVKIGSYSQGNNLRGEYNKWIGNINSQIDNLFSLPSWNGTTVKGKVGNTIELDGENKIDGSIVIKNGGSDVVIENGKVKITVNNNSENGKAIFYKRIPNVEKYETLTLIYEKSGSQTLASVGYDVDPINFSVNLEVEKNPTRARTLKVDADTREKLPGAEFEYCYDEDFTSSRVYTFVTDAEGYTEWDTWSIQGRTVYVREKKAPVGYEKSNEVKSFVVTDGGEVELIFENTKKTFNVPLKKSNLTTGGVVEGATIKVYKVGEDKDPIFTVISDKEGNFPGVTLPGGEYYFIETDAPEGYILNPEKQFFTISKDGKITGTTNLPNELKKYDVTLIKNDDTLIKALQGASFDVFNADTNKKVLSGVTNEKGEFSFKVVYGNYYAVETKAPVGYVLNSEKIYFSVAKNGKVTGTTNIKNKPIESEYILTKKDTINLKTVAGATVEFENVLTKEKITKVTDENGKIKIKLTYGEWIYKETIAPIGYVKATKYGKINVTENGAVIEEILWNKPIESEYILTKKDTLNLKTVPGAEIEIINLETKEVVFKGVTDENGQIKVKLRYGKYKVIETIAPEGYVKAEKHLEINVTEEGATIEQELWNEPITSEYILTKKDTVNLKTVPGAEVEIRNLETKEVVFKGVTDENGQIKVKLRYGRYEVIETVAPKGYIKAEKHLEINVTENGVVIEQVLWNEPVKTIHEIPKTAISSGTMFNLGMLFVALTLIVVVILNKRKTDK